MLPILKNLWKYRNFIQTSIRSDLITRFARSKLGGLWIILNPLFQVAIFTLILSNVLAAKLPGIENKYAYAIYLMSGLLAWTLFSEIVSRCLNLFIENANLLKKMQFPRITLPAIIVGSNLINNALLFASMVCVFLLMGHQFSPATLWLIPIVCLLTSFALGIGLILGILNVFVRDVGQVVPIILQAWFWFTPIVYPATIIPEAYRHLLNFNPMYHFASAYNDVIVYNRAPQIEGIITIGIASGILLIFSLFLFRKANEEMVDVL